MSNEQSRNIVLVQTKSKLKVHPTFLEVKLSEKRYKSFFIARVTNSNNIDFYAFIINCEIPVIN